MYLQRLKGLERCLDGYIWQAFTHECVSVFDIDETANGDCVIAISIDQPNSPGQTA